MSTEDELRRQLPHVVGAMMRTMHALLAEMDKATSMERLLASPAAVAAAEAWRESDQWIRVAAQAMPAKGVI